MGGRSQWNNNMFIWLDYDFQISATVVHDIQIVSNYIQPGGIVVITLDAEPKRFDSIPKDPELSVNGDRLRNLKKELHPYFPLDISKKDFSVPCYPLLLRQIIITIIEDTLRKRDIRFFQICRYVRNVHFWLHLREIFKQN